MIGPRALGVNGLKPGQCQPSFEAWASTIRAQDRERIIKTARDAAAAGREYEIQWRVILAAMPAAVIIAKDADCIDMAGDRSAYDLLRLAPHQDLSKSAPPERAPKNYEVFANGVRLSPDEMPIQRAAASGTTIIREELEVRFVEGDSKFVLSNALPLFDDNGQVRGAVGAFADVTELKHTEAALRESEKLERRKRKGLEAIFAAIPAPVLIATDASCENMIGNPAAYQLYRVPPGTNIAKSAPAEEAPANFEIFQNGRHLTGEELPIRRAAAKRTFSGEEIELRFVEGDSKYLLGNALPLLDDAGEAFGAVAAFADVTELRRTEAALRESKAKLEAALAAMSDAVCITDGKGNFIHFNGAFATYYKFKSKEDCAVTFAQYPAVLDVFLPNGNLAMLDQWVLPRALRGETAIGAEYGVRRKDTGERARDRAVRNCGATSGRISKTYSG